MRTDLAAECLKHTKTFPKGVYYHRQPLKDACIEVVEIQTDDAEQRVEKPKGLYVTLELPPFWDESAETAQLIEVVSTSLQQFLPADGAVLVVGLGNRDITPDALGPDTAEQILVTRHMEAVFPELRTVAAIAPNVLGKTGMEAAETVKAVVKEVKPAAVIVVDALASASLERLGSTVQITDSGIAPGSGVLNARKSLNRESLNVPVIAVGIPTVVDLSSLLSDLDGEAMMTTPRQIDLLIQRGAAFLATAINRALHPSLTQEELLLLQS